MDKKLLLLKKMCNVREDEVGRKHYQKLKCKFMQFKDDLEMAEKEYIEYIKLMCKDEYMEYNMSGHNDIKDASIIIGDKGMLYLEENDREMKIGF